MSELAVMVPALVAAHGGWFVRRPRWSLTTSLMVVVLAVGGVVAALRWGVPMGADPPRRLGLGHERANLPDAATRFLGEVAPPGRVFNILAFGGWLIHELWPERQVFVDGRLDVFPPGFLAAYQRLMHTGEGWDEAVERHGIAFAVVDFADDPARDAGLRSRLRRDDDWVVVLFADNVLVYARRVPANAELVRRFGCPFDPSLRTPASLTAWLGRAPAADVAQAAAAVGRMLPLAPEAATPRALLGSLLLRAAELDLEAGDRDGAVARLEQAVALTPEKALAHMRLGILHAKAGELAAARRHFEAARALSPDDPAVRHNLRLLDTLEPGR